MVDVETGAEPSPNGTRTEPTPSQHADAASRVSSDRAVTRHGLKPARITATRVRAQPEARVPEETTHLPAPAPDDVAESDVSDAVLGDGELLWLEDQRDHTSAEPGDGSIETTPWRRGLRG